MKVLTIVSIAVAALAATVVRSVLTGGFSGSDIAYAADAAPATAVASTLSTPPANAESIAVVDRFSHALASGGTIGASALLDPAVVIYESGDVERSRAEYAAHHLAADAAFLKTVEYRLLSRTSGTAGDLAWVATESRLMSHGEKPVDIFSTETMVLRKQPSGWRIVHIHWSSRKAAR